MSNEPDLDGAVERLDGLAKLAADPTFKVERLVTEKHRQKFAADLRALLEERERMREALTVGAIWHEAQAWALSKQPPVGDQEWRRLQHGDQAAALTQADDILTLIAERASSVPLDQKEASAQRNHYAGVRASIAWLHARADQMNDPHAKGVLNSAAFALGVDKPLPATPALGGEGFEELSAARSQPCASGSLPALTETPSSDGEG